MTELHINPELRDMIPSLDESEMLKLRQDIEHDGGIIDPLIYAEIGGKNVILDGHHRYGIAQQFRLEDFPVYEYKWRNAEAAAGDDAARLREAKLWVLNHALGTRSLTTYGKVIVAYKKYRETYGAAAKEAREAAQRRAGETKRLGRYPEDNSQVSHEGENRKAAHATKDTGVSEITCVRAIFIYDVAMGYGEVGERYAHRRDEALKLSAKLFNRHDKDVSIKGVYTLLHKDQKPEEKPETQASVPESKLLGRLPKVVASVTKYEPDTVAGQAGDMEDGELKELIRKARLSAQWFAYLGDALEEEIQRREIEDSAARAEELEAKAREAADARASAEALLADFPVGALFSTSEYPRCEVLSTSVHDPATPVVEFDAGPEFPRRKHERYMEEAKVHEEWGSKILPKQNPHWGEWIDEVWPRQFVPTEDETGNRNYAILEREAA